MSTRPNPLISIFNGMIPLLIAGGVLFVLTIIGGKAVQGYEMRQEAKAIEARIENLKKDNRKLVHEIDYYRSDEYIEKVAREELGLIRPGDVAVVIVPQDGRASASPLLQPTATPVAAVAGPPRDIPNWQRWLLLFTGKD